MSWHGVGGDRGLQAVARGGHRVGNRRAACLMQRRIGVGGSKTEKCIDRGRRVNGLLDGMPNRGTTT
jgi:hypothetical protein